MKRIKQLMLFLFLSFMAQIHAQNISTGTTNSGAALPTGVADPNWRITAGPSGPMNAINSIPAFPWQTAPVSGSNAGWINGTGLPCSNPTGNYTFERSFTMSNSAANFVASLKVAYDDSLVSLALIDPNGTVIPLAFTPTTIYNLSLPISYTQNSPIPGTWRIQAVLHIVADTPGNIFCGGFMLEGEITTSCTPLCTCDALVPKFDDYVDLCEGIFTSTSDVPPCVKEAGTDTYKWTVDGVYAGSGSTLNYTFPSNGTYTICLQVIAIFPDGTECVKQFCREIEVKNCSGCSCDNIIPNIDYNVDKCSGVFVGNATLPACAQGSQVTYDWFINSTFVGSGSPLMYPFTGNGYYTVCLNVGVTLPDGTKCSQDTCMQILVTNCGDCHCNQVQPDFNYTVTDCSINLVNGTTGPDCVQRTYKWYVDSVLVGSGNTFNYTFPGSGTYTVCMRVIGTMPGGYPCKPYICKQITVNCGGCCDSLIPSITYNVDKCSSILNGHTILPTCFSGATVSYTWLVNSTYAGSGATLIHPFPGNGFYTVCLYASVILADGTKCTQDTCIQVVVNNCDECKCNQVQPNFTYTVNNCTGSFTDATVGPECIQRSYEWSVDNVVVGTGNTFNYPFPGSGTYTVCMKVIGVMPGGIPCEKTICKQVTVDCGPCNCYDMNSDFSTSFNVCNGTFTSTSQIPGCIGNVTYEWEVDGSFAGTGTILNHAFSTFGAHTVCLKVTGIMPDGTSCTRNACYDVYPPELCPDSCANCNYLQTAMSITPLVCSATFDGSGSNVPSCMQNVLYKWYVGVAGSGLVSPVGTGTTYNHIFGGSGTYTVCLMISGNLPDGTYCEKMECMDVNILCLTVDPPIGGPGHPFPHGKTVNLYPNPASDNLTIELELEEAGEVQLVMRSSDGKELINEKRDAKAGLQRFDLKIPESIASSMVFIEISANQEKITRMVNIQK